MRTGILIVASLVTLGCGEETCTDLSGSAAGGLSLAWDSVAIQRFSTGPSLVVKYLQGVEGLPAILSVNTGGVALEAGLSLDFQGDPPAAGAPAHAFGNASRSMEDGQQFGEVEGGTLTLEAWSGGRAEGSIGYRFDDGGSLRGDFCGAVQDVVD